MRNVPGVSRDPEVLGRDRGRAHVREARGQREGDFRLADAGGEEDDPARAPAGPRCRLSPDKEWPRGLAIGAEELEGRIGRLNRGSVVRPGAAAVLTQLKYVGADQGAHPPVCRERDRVESGPCWRRRAHPTGRVYAAQLTGPQGARIGGEERAAEALNA